MLESVECTSHSPQLLHRQLEVIGMAIKVSPVRLSSTTFVTL